VVSGIVVRIIDLKEEEGKSQLNVLINTSCHVCQFVTLFVNNKLPVLRPSQFADQVNTRKTAFAPFLVVLIVSLRIMNPLIAKIHGRRAGLH